MRATIFATLFFAVGISTVVAASSFSLNKMEPITESEVPEDCFKVYESGISACGTSSTPSCTTECTNSLLALASDIQLACADAFVGMDSLLRRTVDGGLLQAVCASYEAPSEIVDSTMEASNIILSTLYPEPSTATKTGTAETVPTSIAFDSAEVTLVSSTKTSVASTGGLAVDRAPSPTAGLASGSLDALFASATASSFPSAEADSAGAANTVSSLTLLVVIGIVAVAASV
ncbi:hypothetical protein BZA05DRAFT_413149 [Tricharina praecox]|uniref:uncharacterized protein n=1 Tax=Tricharina praecox TaxID=43433 RepID=UPI0022205545|nr:uncharacterized protein BZA05DRAFT_413149 [Tricharina praecox]KAI5841312.1 hypothetical protein BZA05DRAFT_413149 [Tricharina praecox]